MRALPALLLLLALTGCQLFGNSVPPVRESRELVVVTRNSPSTYYLNADGLPAGLEYDLVMLFAKELGVEARFVVAERFGEVLPSLERGRAHLAAAGLAVTGEREKKFRFGPSYRTSEQQVVYNVGSDRPEEIEDLLGKRVEVVAGSSYVERLRELRKTIPALKWTEIDQEEDSDELLERVAQKATDYVVADSNIVAVAQNFYPELDVGFSLSATQHVAWAFPQNAEPWLLDKAKAFFARIARDGTLKRLIDRHFGHVERLERAEVSGFLQRMNTVLPDYRRLFRQAQELTDIDWRLFAALGYQESHWNPYATSPTGVRGLMMLTEDTADRMGVENRLEPKQDIPAAARYLLTLKDSLPRRIREPDRTWMAVAAYNVGLGHLEDARVLAQRMKLNPDSWADLKNALPLLAKPQHYATLKHGYARGGEPVIFTENVRTYYDILLKYEKPHDSMIRLPDPYAENNN